MTVNKLISIIVIIALILCLVAVRLFESELFYDPLISYFNSQFHEVPFPEIKTFYLIGSTLGRYLLNTVISLGILYFLYKRKKYIKAALWIYVFALVILTPLFLVLLQMDGEFTKRALFYVRRFLIHPIILFVLVAGCYFLEQKNKSRV